MFIMNEIKELYDKIILDIKNIEIIYFDMKNYPEQHKYMYDSDCEKNLYEDIFILQKVSSKNSYNIISCTSYQYKDCDGYGPSYDLGLNYNIISTTNISKKK